MNYFNSHEGKLKIVPELTLGERETVLKKVAVDIIKRYSFCEAKTIINYLSLDEDYVPIHCRTVLKVDLFEMNLMLKYIRELGKEVVGEFKFHVIDTLNGMVYGHDKTYLLYYIDKLSGELVEKLVDIGNETSIDIFSEMC